MILYTLGMHRCLKRWEIFLCENVQIKDENMKGILVIKNHIWESFNHIRYLGLGYNIITAELKNTIHQSRRYVEFGLIIFLMKIFPGYRLHIRNIQHFIAQIHPKMQHKNVLFIQEFSNWQFKHVQLLSYTVNHEIMIF